MRAWQMRQAKLVSYKKPNMFGAAATIAGITMAGTGLAGIGAVMLGAAAMVGAAVMAGTAGHGAGLVGTAARAAGMEAAATGTAAVTEDKGSRIARAIRRGQCDAVPAKRSREKNA